MKKKHGIEYCWSIAGKHFTSTPSKGVFTLIIIIMFMNFSGIPVMHSTQLSNQFTKLVFVSIWQTSPPLQHQALALLKPINNVYWRLASLTTWNEWITRIFCRWIKTNCWRRLYFALVDENSITRALQIDNNKFSNWKKSLTRYQDLVTITRVFSLLVKNP